MYSVYIMLMYLTKLETYEYENNSISIKRTVHGHWMQIDIDENDYHITVMKLISIDILLSHSGDFF